MFFWSFHAPKCHLCSKARSSFSSHSLTLNSSFLSVEEANWAKLRLFKRRPHIWATRFLSLIRNTSRFTFWKSCVQPKFVQAGLRATEAPYLICQEFWITWRARAELPDKQPTPELPREQIMMAGEMAGDRKPGRGWERRPATPLSTTITGTWNWNVCLFVLVTVTIVSSANFQRETAVNVQFCCFET